ncbi:hypothetical protein [Spirosoma litoris]
MTAFSGLFIIALIAQPSLAQNRRASSQAPATPSANTPSSQGTSSGSELGNYRNERADAWIPLEAEKRQAS